MPDLWGVEVDEAAWHLRPLCQTSVTRVFGSSYYRHDIGQEDLFPSPIYL